MRPQTVSDEEILAVARRIFLEQGPQVSVQVIANELGVSQPALFKRFGNKQNLLISAIRPPEVIPWFEHAVGGPDDRPFTVQLRELIGEIFSFFRDVLPSMLLLQKTEIGPMEMLKGMEEPPPLIAVRILSAWLERCCDKGLVRRTDFRITAMTILGTLHFDHFIMMFDAELGSKQLTAPAEEEYLDGVIELIWQGLKYEE